MNSEQRTVTLGAAIVAAGLSFAAGSYIAVADRNPPKPVLGVAGAPAAPESSPGLKSGSEAAPPADSIELSATQLKSVKVETAAERDFPIEKVAIGSIDFNEEMLTQVFTPNQGRIVGLFAKVGDEVLKGQTLFTIDSPDLVQASSTLISAAGVANLTTRNLARLKGLYETRASSQKELEQAISDQQAAEGALRAARDAVRIFGKTEAEIDRIIEGRRVDPVLVVASPIRAASPPAMRRPDYWSSPAMRRRPTW